MKGTGKTKRATGKAESKTKSHHLRLHLDLDDWLKQYAERKGHDGPVDAVKQLIRNEREREEAQPA